MVASKHGMNLHKTAITQCLDSGMGFSDTQNDEGLGACFSEKYIIILYIAHAVTPALYIAHAATN